MNVLLEHEKYVAEMSDEGYRSSSLSTEGFGSFVKGINEIFLKGVRKMRDVFTGIGERFKMLFVNNDLSGQVRELNRLHTEVSNILKKADYGIVANKPAPTIIGLKTNLHDLSIRLLSVCKDLDASALSAIDDLDTTISKIIADRDYIKSVNMHNNIKKEKEKDNLEKFISSLIDHNGTNDITVVGKLLPNVSSLKDIHNNTIRLNALVKQDMLNSINDKLIQLDKKIDIMLDELTNNDMFNNSSKVVLTKLSNDMRLTAEYISLVSSVYYLVNQNNGIVIKLINILK